MDKPRFKRRTSRFERALRIEAGEVVCPRRGIVDIEDCWVCPQYRGLSQGHTESMMCGLSEESLASALWALDHAPVPQPH
jgi:hypothetical protein